MKNILISLVGFLLFLVGWESIAKTYTHLLFIIPTPSEIFKTLWEHSDRFWFHSFITLKEMIGGFSIALFTAFPLAWLMLKYKSSRAIIQPFFIIVQCLPMFTLAPIMVIWFGWGYTAIVIPTALMIFFPLTLNIYQGLRATPQELLEFFKTNQATDWQTLIKLQLPWAIPHIFAGFRISSAIAGIGAVAGEWAGGQNGLGILMLESRRNTDLEITFGALFCLTFMSAFLYVLVIWGEKMFFSPHRKTISARPILTYLSLILISITFLACQEKKIETKNEIQPKTTRLLLDWLPNPNHVPLYVGLELGFFKEQGIVLEIQKMHENGHGIAYLTSNQADLLVNHMPGTIWAQARGAHVKIVGSLIKQPLNAIIYSKQKNIEKPEDLNGIILGYCVGGPDTAFLDRMFEEKNISLKEKRNIGVDLIAALGTCSVDAVYGAFWNIEPAQLDSLNFPTGFFHLNEFNVPNYYEMIILARDNCHFASKDFVTRFQTALQHSIDFCKSNPEKAFDYYLKNNLDKRKKTIQWEKKSWEMTYPILSNNQEFEKKVADDFCKWMTEKNLLPCVFDVDTLIP